MIPRALKFVKFRDIEDHFRLGWLVSFANETMHHHHYGVELQWICNCRVPGGFKKSANDTMRDWLVSRENRVPNPQTESATHERTASGA